MNETKVKAISLGGIDYKDKDKLVKLFTLERGIVTVLFKGVKNANAKLKSAKEMFSFGDFIYTEGKSKIVTSADIIDSFYDITKNIKKYYTACCILDIIKSVLPDGEANADLFVNTLKCLKILAFEDVNNYIVLNKFLISVFEGVGYRFDLNACNNCGEQFLNHRYMNLNYGDITCLNCRTGTYVELSASQYSALRILSITDFDKLSTVKLADDLLISVFKILELNFRCRFNKKLQLK